jgi:metal-responsive CopG/Arc/MetJ family transcriptional regulator
MSRATITLPNDLLDELMGVAPAKSKTEAVVRAIRERIRQKKIERIRAAVGILEFAATAEELRHGDKRLG